MKKTRRISANQKTVSNWLGKYYRAVETEDFIYFVNYQESDDNSAVMMFRKETLELVSDNFFASNDLFTIIVDKLPTTWMSRTFQKYSKQD